jgi:hypothetical protein
MASIAELERLENFPNHPTHEQIAEAIRDCVETHFDGRRVRLKLSTTSKFKTALVKASGNAKITMPHIHTIDDVLTDMVGKNWHHSYDRKKQRFTLCPIVES